MNPNLDFTIEKFTELLVAIKNSSYKNQTIANYLQSPAINTIILRHDVDRKPQSALQMARLEYQNDIRSTYYFRITNENLNSEIIEKISDLGHEIGYHYEVMDQANGDIDLAIELFRKNLEMLRKISPVKTVCMHGNPLKPWSNKDIWQHYDFNRFGIIGEPYISIDYKKVIYFTDTGRSWNNAKYSVKDKVNHNLLKINNTEEIIQIINKGILPGICILTHPNRWSSTFPQWLSELIKQNVKNIAKIGLNLWYATNKDGNK